MVLEKLIGIPFIPFGRSFDGCDCSGLVILFYREVLKIQHEDYLIYTDPLANNSEKVLTALNSAKFQKTELSKKQGDLIVIKLFGHATHLGICLNDRYFLHTLKQIGSHLSEYDSLIWTKRIESRWRMIGK